MKGSGERRMVENKFRTLIINPKTNTTTIALFQNTICLYKETLSHHTSFYHASDIETEAKKTLKTNRPTNKIGRYEFI